MYLELTGSNKGKHLRKFGVNTLPPKTRHIKSDQQKLLRTMVFVAKKQDIDMERHLPSGTAPGIKCECKLGGSGVADEM